jgi:dolichyl-phosphate beta-glucosyltransferase
MQPIVPLRLPLIGRRAPSGGAPGLSDPLPESVSASLQRVRADAEGAFCPSRTLVIPMFREAARIETAVQRLAGSTLNDDDTEIIFVDDGSDDGSVDTTAAALAATGLAARILRHETNRGKGGAVRTGVLAARGEIVAFADADLSADIAEIELCFQSVASGWADVVVATRADPNSRITIAQSPLRQFSGKLFNRMLRALDLTEFADTQCGLKGFTRESARQVFQPLTIERFAFDVEVLLRAKMAGFTVRELPIEWRHVEASRVSLFRDSTRMLVDVARLRRRLRKEARRSATSTYARREV